MFYCCIGAPLDSLIKTVIMMPIVTVMATLGCTGSSLIWLPRNIFYSYYTLVESPRLGRKIKVALGFLVMIPLLAWPFLVAIVSVTGSVLGSIGFCFLESYSGKNFWKTKILQATKTIITDFWDSDKEMYMSYLEDMRKPNDDNSVYDISIFQYFY